MSWPLASHFSVMLQNPKIAFRDPELKACRVEKDQRKQPRPWSGAFAVVYKGMSPSRGGAFAIRIFTTESPERRERYDRISEYLKTRRLDCLIDFEYRDRSIRSGSDGRWYPLILMDWVEGDTLFKWARARCLAGDKPALHEAAGRWAGLVKELSDARIAHGDLQHANVMVAPSGKLKLVDYDCMCVPALVGRRNLEVGVEPYQHPDRNETTHLSLDLDNFSALVIYVALRALSAEPLLWEKYVEVPAHDKLLFCAADFRAPEASSLCADLNRSPDPDVRDLTERLLATYRGGMDRVAPLDHLTNSYAKVETLLRKEQWEAAVDLLNRRGQFRDAPKPLKPLIHQAYEYVCRQKAWAEFEQIPNQPGELNDRNRLNAWNESLFAGYAPAERVRARVAAARKSVTVLDRLHHLLQNTSKEATAAEEQNLVLLAKHLPRGYDYSLRPRVERAKQRIGAVARLRKAIRKELGEAAIVEAWQEVADIGCTHLVKSRYRPRIELARRRLPMLQSLLRIPDDLAPDQRDQQILAAWNEELADDYDDVHRWRAAYEEAVARQALLDRIEQAIQSGDDVLLAELAGDSSLEAYALPAHWAGSIRTAVDRKTKAAGLEESLCTGDRSAFLERFDARVIRKHPDRFAEHESRLLDWTRSDVLPLAGLGLAPAVARASLYCTDKSRGTYRVRWTWPQQRFADECILALCSREPDWDDDPRDLDVLFRLPVDRRHWESGGGSRLVHTKPEWGGSLVIVWAMVDLGFRLLPSEPLVLGRLEGTAKQQAGPAKGWNLWTPRGTERSAGANTEPKGDSTNPRGDLP